MKVVPNPTLSNSETKQVNSFVPENPCCTVANVPKSVHVLRVPTLIKYGPCPTMEKISKPVSATPWETHSRGAYKMLELQKDLRAELRKGSMQEEPGKQTVVD